MANEGEDQTRAAAVAKVATRLFGVKVTPDAIIDESLERDLRMLPSRGPNLALPIS